VKFIITVVVVRVGGGCGCGSVWVECCNCIIVVLGCVGWDGMCLLQICDDGAADGFQDVPRGVGNL
jgi:hypothetical protein